MIMHSHRQLLVILAGLIVSLVMGMSPAIAEISAELDEIGEYRRIVYRTNASEKNSRIWAVQRGNKARNVALNQDGDVTADGWPVYVENHTNRNHPHIVWSRFNGHDYDLVWANWIEVGWSSTQWLEWDARSGDDLNPSLTKGEDGRPFLAWWNDEGGVGAVYMSIFLQTRWMEAFPVSVTTVDSRHPVIEILDDGRIRIAYETPDGMVSKILLFATPNTITDDIDPMEHLTEDLQQSNSNP